VRTLSDRNVKSIQLSAVVLTNESVEEMFKDGKKKANIKQN
jgi:hypothetical protein